MSSCSDFLSDESCTPSVILSCVCYDFSSSSIFWKGLTKITQQMQQVLCNISDPSSDLPKPPCQMKPQSHWSFPQQQSTSPTMGPFSDKFLFDLQPSDFASAQLAPFCPFLDSTEFLHSPRASCHAAAACSLWVSSIFGMFSLILG